MIKKCEECGAEFEAIDCRQRLCSAECRRIRKRESNRVAQEMYRLRQQEESGVEIMSNPKHKTIDEVQFLAEKNGLSYGYYVGLKHQRGERV